MKTMFAERQTKDDGHQLTIMGMDKKSFDAEDDEDVHDVAKEQIIEAIGSFGKWQMRKCLFIMSVIWIPGSVHLLSMVFHRAHTDHWCAKPPELRNVSEDIWRGLSSPNLDNGCNLYDLDFSSLFSRHRENVTAILADPLYENAKSINSLVGCSSYHGWEYDRTFWKRTIVQEWDLVCDRSYMAKLVQQVTFFGLLCGAFASGILSDRFGRVLTAVGLAATLTIVGTASSFSPSYTVFLCATWVNGFAALGFGTVLYCWTMEVVSGKAKTVFGCVPHLNFACGGLLVAAVAYVLPDWRHMQLALNIPQVLLLSVYWILPESPRWLLAHGRTEKAEEIVEKIATFNGRALGSRFKLVPPKHHAGRSHQKQSGHGVLGFLDLFKTPNMRMKTGIIYYTWFATSFVYYGLTLNSNHFGASLFVYFSLGKVIEIPFVVSVILLLIKAGRRLSLILLFAVCGIGLLATIVIPTGYFSHEWPHVALNILGRGSSIGCLSLCYVYSAEVFPTVTRNVGLGSSSVWARVGPMIAPYVAELSVFEPRLPIAFFGVIALVASFLVTFLPETAHHKLPDTLAEGEELGKGDTLWKQSKCCRGS